MVIGTNNYHSCPYGGNCTPNGAGTQWGTVTNDVKNYLSALGYTWQITVWAGSDMEQPGGTQLWDCASRTRQYVDGFNANDPSTASFVNYGTAWVPNSCWTVGDVRYVSWGASYDWPVPEIYTQAALDSWMTIRSGQNMTFLGELTECSGGDVLPSSNCMTKYGSTQWAPIQAWTNLWNTLNNRGFGQASLDYSTNIADQL